ncbi:hypothetical protein Pint_04132 [Pistacia integerrima]|uniref:Uncharacterized protein n=1 Tax=Pistacia integerrima TaxID=434235 RepID=A0ACC0Z631_9ROSI|nr:hypothetical protein Pint_04132 [Pistacia integerrima]
MYAVFNYNNHFHKCKGSGASTVIFCLLDHQYFLCGIPDHRETGQKVDIMVTPVSLRPSASSSYPSSPSASSPLPHLVLLSTPLHLSNVLSFWRLWFALPFVAAHFHIFPKLQFLCLLGSFSSNLCYFVPFFAEIFGVGFMKFMMFVCL